MHVYVHTSSILHMHVHVCPQVQEDYIKDELKNLRSEYLYAQEEVKRIQSVPLVIGQFLEAVDQNYAIVGSTTG